MLFAALGSFRRNDVFWCVTRQREAHHAQHMLVREKDGALFNSGCLATLYTHTR